MRNKQSKKGIKCSSIILFIIGLCLILFPLISQTAYYMVSHKQINEFNKEVSNINSTEIERRIRLAQAYNETLDKNGRGIEDPYTNIQKEGRSEYARMLKVNEKIGYVEIPTINLKGRYMQVVVKKCYKKGLDI